MKTLLLILLLATPALAQPTIELVPTCVKIDVENDELPAAERETARLLLVRALERQERLVVETGCEDTVELSHQLDGRDMIVRMRNAIARRKLTVSVKAEMSEVYARVARSLYEPEPAQDPEPSPAAYTQPEVYEAPAVESSVPVNTRLWYLQLGLGTLGRVSAVSSTWGIRRGSNRTVADIAVIATSADSDRTSLALRGQVLRYVHPEAESSAFLGGGASLGTASYSGSKYMERAWGSGARLDGTAGFEWNRSSSTRYSVEASLALPLYTVGDGYPATFAFTLGFAR